MGQQGKGGDYRYSSSPLPPAHKHSGIYFQFCKRVDYHVFLIASHVITRVLLDEVHIAFNYQPATC